MCHADKLPKLGYIAASLEADKRIARGQTQRRCAVCLKCRWPNEQKVCPQFVAVDEVPDDR